MRAVGMIAKKLEGGLQAVHKIRREAVFFAVGGLLWGRRLGLSALGRSGRGRSSVKHQIKRIDRLLGNRHLHRERGCFARAIAALLWRGQRWPLLVVDWTKLPGGRWALCAAIPMEGRAVLLYSEVYSSFRCNKRTVFRQFVHRLHDDVVPEGCTPVVVTDAGFTNTWFRLIRQVGWHYLSAVPTFWKVQRTEGAGFRRFNQLYRRGPRQPLDLGFCTVGMGRRSHRRRVVLSRPPRTNGAGRSQYLPRHKKAGAQSWARKRATRICVVVTSIAELSTARVIEMYKTRMSIEECFRDLKNVRWGWGLSLCLSRTCKRWEILLLLAGLGQLATWLLGTTIKRHGTPRAYQANTESRRTVLSWFALAQGAIAQQDPVGRSARCLAQVLKTAQQTHVFTT